MDRDHRVVVVGNGDVGAAAAYRLGRAHGARVLVLDAGAEPEPGDTRPVRSDLAHPDDARTALAPAAQEAWRDLERLSGQTLLTTTPGVVVAGRDRPEVGRRTAVADRHGLAATVLDARGLARRWPQLRPRADDHAFVTEHSALLDAARAAAVHRALAAGHGVELRYDTAVRALRPRAGHVEVVLDDGEVDAATVLVAAGAGTTALLAGLHPLPLAEHVEQSGSYATPRLLDFCPGHFPVLDWYGWAPPDVDGPRAHFTGWGTHGAATTRLVQHGPAAPDPTLRRAFLDAHVPDLAGSAPERGTVTRTVVTPRDGAMALGLLPNDPRIGVAAGTGAHPAFAGVAGRALADLLVGGRTRSPIVPFALDRATLGPAGTSGAARPAGATRRSR